MGCCGGSTGTSGMGGVWGGVTRWIMPVLFALVLAMLVLWALSGRGRSLGGTEAPATSPANRASQP